MNFFTRTQRNPAPAALSTVRSAVEEILLDIGLRRSAFSVCVHRCAAKEGVEGGATGFTVLVELLNETLGRDCAGLEARVNASLRRKALTVGAIYWRAHEAPEAGAGSIVREPLLAVEA